jgi:hypothetical protein
MEVEVEKTVTGQKDEAEQCRGRDQRDQQRHNDKSAQDAG